MRRVAIIAVIVFSLLIPVITISCDTTQQPEGEAWAEIGPEGGVVEVTDPSSPAYGTKLEIAQGALNESVLIEIIYLGEYQLPDSFTPAGPIVELLPSGLNIAGNASTITIPYDPLIVGDDIYSLSIGIYSSADDTWRFPNIIEIDTSDHTITGELGHFSVASSILPPDADFSQSVECNPSFNFATDKMVDNYITPDYCSKYQNGVCNGISIYTRWYFTNPDCGHGLWNLYSDETASKIACYVHDEVGNLWRFANPTDWRTACFLWDGLHRTQKPQLLYMSGEDDGDTIEHMVLVYAWDADNKQFKMYDSNNNGQEAYLPFDYPYFEKYDGIFTLFIHMDWKDKYNTICNEAYNNPLYQPGLITFPDSNLEAVIREAIDKPTGAIYASDVEGLTSVEAEEKNITDLTGLEYATSLTSLNLIWNQISSISPLANLTGLTQLFLGWNQISSISPLANLTNLEYLGLNTNHIIDISPLANLTSLKLLALTENQISIISPLANLTDLTLLTARDNQIIDISSLASLTNLEHLWVEDNQISDISPLVDNAGLGNGDNVYLSGNPLSSDSINIYIPQLQARGVDVDY